MIYWTVSKNPLLKKKCFLYKRLLQIFPYTALSHTYKYTSLEADSHKCTDFLCPLIHLRTLMRLSFYLFTLEMSRVLNISCMNWIPHIVSQPCLSLLGALVQASSYRPLPDVPVFYLLCCPLPTRVEEPFRLLIQNIHSCFRNLLDNFIIIYKNNSVMADKILLKWRT